MKLIRIYFRAYKSLINERLDIVDNCIGFVGINESGKSNILQAISVLSRDKNLKSTDSPKMAKGTDPHIIFEFNPSTQTKNKMLELLVKWYPEEIDDPEKFLNLDDWKIQYNVKYDIKEKKEKRFFEIININKTPKKSRYLKYEAKSELLLWKRRDNFLKLSEVFITTESEIKANKKLYEKLTKYYELYGQLNEPNENLDESIKTNNDEAPTNIGEQNSISPEKEKLSLAIEELKQELGDFISIENTKDKIKKRDSNKIECDNLEKNNKELQSILDGLEKKETRDASQETQLKNTKVTISSNSKKIVQLTNANLVLEREIKSLEEPIEDKFSEDMVILSRRIGEQLEDEWISLLPGVVFWQHSEDYILYGETEFNSIIEATSLNEISRPLVNMFRIGLGTQTLKELKDVIQEIQTNPSERSRYQARLNKEINAYLDVVWTDYDQEISVTLEQERIRVLFFDPDCKDASYYEMNERSQGCQTFISFLLTIGAEAKKGVITDTVLLLDEPETHLHPSGVRFMLKELIAASKQSNYVFFATHSIFMIDKENYNRYMILKKIHEHTTVSPSSKERVGYFMQEEVLYGSLNIDLTEEFNKSKKYNFVFEGEGDAILFAQFYEKGLAKSEQPFDLREISFYQGGKCTDIRKYFSHTPVQLGSTWIIVLDNDPPANELKKFFESKYKDFINKYVYIFQYRVTSSAEISETELEDLLSNEVIEGAASLNKDQYFAEDAILPGRKDFDSFKSYLNTLIKLSKINADYQGFYKQQLNLLLNDLAKNLKTKENFNSKLPIYKEWAESVINNIKESEKKK